MKTTECTCTVLHTVLRRAPQLKFQFQSRTPAELKFHFFLNHTSVYSIEETYSPERCSVKIIATKSKQISLPGVPLAVSAYGGIVAALLSLSHC